MSVNEDLAKERSRITFNVQELSEFLYDGPKNYKDWMYLQTLLSNDPDYDNSNVYFYSSEEAYEETVRKDVQFLKKRKELNIDQYAPIVISMITGLVTPLSTLTLHKSMFRNLIKMQGTEEQVLKWISLIDNLQIIGTYAQTEMGHGTYIRGLETTATYDPKTQNFILHSPTLSSTKWWPGSLGHTVTHAVVIARLITLGKDYGIHSFIVQLRSLEDHSILPGVKLGMIGPKMGCNPVDNGFLILNNVAIPRENMFLKFSQVSKDGEYSRTRGTEKLTYTAMVTTRVSLSFQSAICLSKACTIAIRYSAVRRQSKLNASEPELQVLDYKTLQYSLLPLLATAYAFWFTAFEINRMHSEVENEIEKGNLGNVQELHAISAGLKAFTTQTAATGVETCRFRCGGHGFSMSSGLPSLYIDFAAPSCTYEGDNIVLMLQTARYLMKCCALLASGETVLTPTAAYLSASTMDMPCLAVTSHDFKNPQTLLLAYKHRAARLVTMASKKLQEKIASGLSPEVARNHVSIDLVKAAKAHIHMNVVERFAKTVEEEKFSNELRHVLRILFNLYAIHGIVENAGDFLEDQYINGVQMRLVNDVLTELLEELRPNAVGLVDAFVFSDYSLNSVLGRYDGNVYEHLMKWAERFPMNRKEVLPAYEKYLRPLLKRQLSAKL